MSDRIHSAKCSKCGDTVVYYNQEHKNFYCARCCGGMGLAYYYANASRSHEYPLIAPTALAEAALKAANAVIRGEPIPELEFLK